MQNEEKIVKRRLEEINDHIHNQELEHDVENEQINCVLEYFLDQKAKYSQRSERIRMLHQVESFGEIISSGDIVGGS